MLPEGIHLPADLENALNTQLCKPDSVRGYTFITPSDSVHTYRERFYHYGDLATTRYLYLGTGLVLERIDSTVYDALGREIFVEYHELDEDIGVVTLRRQEFFYPRGTGSLLDSTIYHRVSSGALAPDTRIVNLYSAGDRLEEVQVSFWNPFLLPPSWQPASKTVYFYGANNQIEYLEEYVWDGLDYLHTSTTTYTYDGNDSLSVLLTSDAATGAPIQKAEYTYDTDANSIRLNGYYWDNQSSTWVEQSVLFYQYDEQGRLEVFDFAFNFFGWFGQREVYEYLGDSPCRWRTLLYYYDGVDDWIFAGILYYFPIETGPTSVHHQPDWTWGFFPNPASEGVWVQAPPGAELRLFDVQGRLLQYQIATGSDYLRLPKTAASYLLLEVRHGEERMAGWVLLQPE